MIDHIDTIETNLSKARGILHCMMYDSNVVNDRQARQNAAWAAQDLLTEAGASLQALVKLQNERQAEPEQDQPVSEAEPAALQIDLYRHSRAVSILDILLEKMDGDAETGLGVCHTLETAIHELRAAVPD